MSAFKSQPHSLINFKVRVERRGARACVTSLLCAVPLFVTALWIPSADASSSLARTKTAMSASTVAVQMLAPKMSRFCTYAESASKSSVASAVITTPKSLQAAYAKLKMEEPTVLADVPKQIRGNFQTLFNYFNKFYGELAAVKYNFLALSHTYLANLAISAASVKSAALAIEHYLTKNCAVSAKG